MKDAANTTAVTNKDTTAVLKGVDDQGDSSRRLLAKAQENTRKRASFLCPLLNFLKGAKAHCQLLQFSFL